MNHYQAMTSVILPQALRNIMPQIGNNFIINVKDTSVMFIIGFPDFCPTGCHRLPTFTLGHGEMAGYLSDPDRLFPAPRAGTPDGRQSSCNGRPGSSDYGGGRHRHPRVPG